MFARREVVHPLDERLDDVVFTSEIDEDTALVGERRRDRTCGRDRLSGVAALLGDERERQAVPNHIAVHRGEKTVTLAPAGRPLVDHLKGIRRDLQIAKITS